MQTKPKGERREKWTEEEIKSKQSWTGLIPVWLWEDIVKKINLSGEYPKGTQTSPRHVTYSSYLNKTAETIRLNSNNRFRTETEIFRIAIHIGIAVLYYLFCLLPDGSMKKARGHFFYQALTDLEKKLERAGMVAIVREKLDELRVHVNAGNMTDEEAKENMEKLIQTVDKSDQDYVRNFVASPRLDNVKMMNSDLNKKIMGL